jgi:hypothetical protein
MPDLTPTEQELARLWNTLVGVESKLLEIEDQIEPVWVELNSAKARIAELRDSGQSCK